MEYQKKKNLLDNQTTQPSRFKTKNWIEINYDRHGAYDKKNLKFKTTRLNASLCDYNDTYRLAEGRITAVGQGADGNDKEVVFQNCAPFTSCISKINNAEVDNAKDLDIVMPMYNL